MEIERISEILSERYKDRLDKGRPYIVAIDGLSGAGKTTLSNGLRAILENKNINTYVLHIDDFIEPRTRRYHTGQEEWYEYYYLQWDVENLRKQLFEPLRKNDTSLSLPFYEAATDSIDSKTYSFSPYCIVLIEGIFLQRKEWKDYYDWIIYVDCPREIRYKRVLERDSYIGNHQARVDKYSRRYWSGEEHYLNTVKPVDLADLIVEVE